MAVLKRWCRVGKGDGSARSKAEPLPATSCPERRERALDSQPKTGELRALTGNQE